MVVGRVSGTRGWGLCSGWQGQLGNPACQALMCQPTFLPLLPFPCSRRRPLQGSEWLVPQLSHTVAFPAGILVVLDAPTLQQMEPAQLTQVREAMLLVAVLASRASLLCWRGASL